MYVNTFLEIRILIISVCSQTQVYKSCWWVFCGCKVTWFINYEPFDVAWNHRLLYYFTSKTPYRLPSQWLGDCIVFSPDVCICDNMSFVLYFPEWLNIVWYMFIVFLLVLGHKNHCTIWVTGIWPCVVPHRGAMFIMHGNIVLFKWAFTYSQSVILWEWLLWVSWLGAGCNILM